MRTQTQLELLRTLRVQRAVATGFTLVELMIVVAIVGILSALAIPNFLNARRAAEAGARIGESIGLAKECATSAASDLEIGVTTSGPGVTYTPTSNCVGGGTVVASFQAGVAGLRCLNVTSAATSVRATITVTPDGALSCTFA